MNVQIMGGGMSVQYPVNMEIAGRVCVIIGGGRVAERKAHVLLQAGAHLIGHVLAIAHVRPFKTKGESIVRTSNYQPIRSAESINRYYPRAPRSFPRERRFPG